jgi:hypothetical protein
MEYTEAERLHDEASRAQTLRELADRGSALRDRNSNCWLCENGKLCCAHGGP